MKSLLILTLGLLVLRANAAPPADFEVRAPADGHTFRLSEARGRYVVLHFLLKTECPFCLRHTREYARASGQLTNTVQVFLKPDSEEQIKAWIRSLGDEAARMAPIYQDVDARLADAFGIPSGYRFHGETVHYPALVLLDPEGREIFRHIGRNNTDRYPLAQLRERLAEHRRGAKPATQP